MLVLLAAVPTLRADFVVFVAPGNPSPTAFSLAITNNGVLGTSQGRTPAVGTPAYNTFNGHVVFSSTLYTVYESPNHDVVAHVLSHLNPNRRYSLRGTTVRGDARYTNRWALFELSGAQSFTAAHTSNCLSSVQVSTLASNQVAINTGANHTANSGDIFDWEDVQPDETGSLVIYSRQYTGPVPGGSSASTYAYALAFLRVEEFGTNQGPVVITQQPQSQTAAQGAPASFAVQAHAFGAPIWYQWLKDSEPIAGATNAAFGISAVTENDAGLYAVVVSNSISSRTSVSAELVVVPPNPEILSQPVSRIGLEGSNTVFAVVARGAPVLSYQWQFNERNILGATSGSFTLTSVQGSNAGVYRVVITNNYGTVVSSNAELGVTTLSQTLNCTNLVWALDTQWATWFPQTSVTHDGALALESGALSRGITVSAALSTTVAGPCTLRFWMKMAAADPQPYTVLWIDGQIQLYLKGNVDWQPYVFYLGTNLHTLSWKVYASSSPEPEWVVAWLDEVTYLPGGQPPDIVTGPSDQTILVGETVTFHVEAEGRPPIRYQWQFNGTDLLDATNGVLSVHRAHACDGGTYTAIVSNDYSQVTADARLVVLESGPVFLPQRTNVNTIAGGAAWIWAGVLGSEPRRYQWRFEGVALPGETNEVLKLWSVGPSQVGRYSVVASNHLGYATGPDIRLALTDVRHVIHISCDGLAGTHLAHGLQVEPDRFPNFRRLLDEGAGTLNARCDYFISYTVPNHLSMLTGRPSLQPAGWANTAHHGFTPDSSPAGVTIHNSGNTNVPYKASVFDVAHDRGLTTACLVSKTSLAICATSYDAGNGAPDLVDPDDGRNKIDFVVVQDLWGSNLVDVLETNLAAGIAPGYTFLHLGDMDYTGHSQGWGSAAWFDTLAGVDAMIGRILETVETNASLAVAEQTAVLVTADHGGGSPYYTHVPASEYANFTIPLLAWGPGFPAGADLHSLFSNRADLGTNWLDYNARPQPLRNGDTGNLALMCLGLPPIPGSSMIPLLESAAPRLTLQPQGDQVRISWSRAAVGFTLESSPALGPSAQWTPITTGIQTNADTFSFSVARGAVPQFYRLTAVR